jgi:hypothetical protein
MDLPFYDPYQSRYQQHATGREVDLTFPLSVAALTVMLGAGYMMSPFGAYSVS